jgi:hypothetical protein
LSRKADVGRSHRHRSRDRFSDAIVVYVDGKPETRLAEKATWMQARDIVER